MKLQYQINVTFQLSSQNMKYVLQKHNEIFDIKCVIDLMKHWDDLFSKWTKIKMNDI